MNQWISDMNDGWIIFSWFSFRVLSHRHGWLKRTEQTVTSSTCSDVNVVIVRFICIPTYAYDDETVNFLMRFVCRRFDFYLDVDLNAQFIFSCLFWGDLLGSWMETLLSSQNCWRTLKWERPVGRYTFTTLCSLSSFTVLFQCPQSDWDFLSALSVPASRLPSAVRNARFSSFPCQLSIITVIIW